MPSSKLPPLLAGIFSCFLALGNAWAADTPLPPGCEAAVPAVPATPALAPSPPPFPPVQLQVRTPLEPAVLPSAGWNYIVYELHLQNLAASAAHVRGIQVLDADKAGFAPIAEFSAARLNAHLRRATMGGDNGDQRQLAAGQSVVAFLCVAFSGNTPVPAKLRHRILLDGAPAEGPAISTQAGVVRNLGRPLTGAGWSPDHNPSLHSHHRMGLWVADGTAHLSRRYALDWKKYNQHGKSWSGDQRDARAYYAYGEKVMAVADGVVVAAQNNYPDNIPRSAQGFETAVPMTHEAVGGNRVVIDIGGGQFAYYAHLQPGSVRVQPGERVKRGQWIARVGNSGDAREPHLHFQVTDGPDILASEGLPHVFERYGMQRDGGAWEARTHEYPMGKVVLDFGPEEDTR